MNTGAVSTATKEATEVGNNILASGGNAFDAVVASAIALTVTEPGNSGLGGEGYCTFYDARTGETGSLCFLGVPGELAVPENVAGDDLIRGVMASLVPGAVAGWFALISEKCSKSAEELIEPSIRLSEEGFVIGDIAGALNWMAGQFHQSAHNIFVRKDRPWRVDDRLHQPELAQTLRMLAKHGEQAFYKGDFADKLDRFYRETGGILRNRDLARYKPLWQKTMSRRFGDVEVHVPPPESTGFAMLYALELLKRAGYGSVPSGGVDAVWMLASVLTKMDECADDIQSAIDKPRIIVGAVIPEGGRNHKIDLESGFAPEVRRKFQPEDDESYHYYGNFHAVQINPDGSFTTAADPNPRLS